MKQVSAGAIMRRGLFVLVTEGDYQRCCEGFCGTGGVGVVGGVAGSGRRLSVFQAGEFRAGEGFQVVGFFLSNLGDLGLGKFAFERALKRVGPTNFFKLLKNPWCGLRCGLIRGASIIAEIKAHYGII